MSSESIANSNGTKTTATAAGQAAKGGWNIGI
jgi:hypothetical protein